jgi:glycosyltransferase involved in cell wall biosynthesis
LFDTFISNPTLKTGISKADKIITNSNFTLKNLLLYKPNVSIVPHYYTVLPRESHNTADKPEHEYFLFVSGDRPMKNFLRTLEAFCVFKKTDKESYHLYVTGVNNELMKRLLRYKKIDKSVVENYVHTLGYVSDETLNTLYINATLLLYTSRYEGFGLPLIEAARCGMPSLASYGTAIPEVLGCGTHYINPLSAKSITNGMRYMVQEDVQKRYRTWLARLYPVLEQRMKFDMEALIDHILE